LKHVPDAHTRLISSVAWAPDGTKFVTVSHDKSLKMWDPDGNEVAWEPDAHSDRIRDVAWAPDGCTLVTVSHDHSIKIWTGS
jgi:WD40 repeat protein